MCGALVLSLRLRDFARRGQRLGQAQAGPCAAGVRIYGRTVFGDGILWQA